MEVIIKKKQFLFFLLFIAILYTGCDNNKEKDLPYINEIGSSIQLEVSYLDFSAQGGKDEIFFDAGTDWEVVQTTESWLKVSPSEGGRGNQISLFIEVNPNNENAERKAQIIVKSTASNIIGNIIPQSFGAGDIPRIGVKQGMGTWIPGPHRGNYNAKPQAGDMILFRYQYSDSDPDEYFSDHVGIVKEVIGDTVWTIEGNSGNGDNWSSRVCKNSYHLKSNSINGYYRPNWAKIGGYGTGGGGLLYTMENTREDAIVREVAYLSGFKPSISKTKPPIIDGSTFVSSSRVPPVSSCTISVSLRFKDSDGTAITRRPVLMLWACLYCSMNIRSIRCRYFVLRFFITILKNLTSSGAAFSGPPSAVVRIRSFTWSDVALGWRMRSLMSSTEEKQSARLLAWA